MKLNRNWVTAVLSTLALLTGSSATQAQWIKKPSDLDPFNGNGSVNKTMKEVDRKRLDAVEGTPYSFTIHNPNAKGIHFRINDMPFLVLGGQGITIRGRGTPKVTFDYGLGNGSYRSYTLFSGRSYVFRWKPASLAAPNDGVKSLLDLHHQ